MPIYMNIDLKDYEVPGHLKEMAAHYLAALAASSPEMLGSELAPATRGSRDIMMAFFAKHLPEIAAKLLEMYPALEKGK
jgi:hypothetical protein